MHAKKIRKTLRALYPEVKTQLDHRDPFELLVATILSAQCTDKQVNQVAPVLFKRLKTPADFAAAPLKSIEKLIRPTGFFHNKAKTLKIVQKLYEQKVVTYPRVDTTFLPSDIYPKVSGILQKQLYCVFYSGCIHGHGYSGKRCLPVFGLRAACRF